MLMKSKRQIVIKFQLSQALPGAARPGAVGVDGVLDGGLDPGVGRHAQVVVAAPHVDRDGACLA